MVGYSRLMGLDEWRIGVHLGDVLIEGDDILGDGVNIAARLEGIGSQVGSAGLRDCRCRRDPGSRRRSYCRPEPPGTGDRDEHSANRRSDCDWHGPAATPRRARQARRRPIGDCFGTQRIDPNRTGDVLDILLTLANSANKPSPVFFTVRPRRSVIFG